MSEIAPRKRPRILRIERYHFVLTALFGLLLVAVPLSEHAEVAIAGGPGKYCEGRVGEVGVPTFYGGMLPPPGVDCFGGAPDYSPDWLLYPAGSLLVAAGVTGAITRTVFARRRQLVP